VLVGFMATGKSSVGLRAAQLLRVPFVDLDVRIEEMTGSTVAAIFEEFGEDAFRRFEAAALARTLADAGQVVAVGGGAVMDDHSWGLVRDGNLVVRLAASREAILERLGTASDRPLAVTAPGLSPATDADARSRLFELMERREARYREAEVQIDTIGRTVEDVGGEVAERARAAGLGRGVGTDD
jgi:shikimate kinase